MTTLQQSLLDAALSYSAKGFSIIPIGADKKPLIKWKEFQMRRASDDELTLWCNRSDIQGIAIVTGGISNLYVLDMEKDADRSGLDICGDTPVVESGGGGYHIYYSNEGHEGIGSFNRFRPDMDFRGEGGYIIAPPSLHPTGSSYRWDISLFKVPLANTPQWLVNMLTQQRSPRTSKARMIMHGVPQGQRNDAAASYAGILLKKTPAEQLETLAWPALKEWNMRNTPPLDESELRNVFDSISGREEGLRAPVVPIDVSIFIPMSLEELQKTLALTIKHDDVNKTVAFLCQLSAFTEDSQFNISFNAPSSTGKSFIPTEVANLFPHDAVKEIGYCSPTAFFHDHGQYDKERNCYFVDLSRKILIFLDQPHNMLLGHLRPLLSHDKKEITMKITDKTQRSGMKTKNIIMRGYPSVIFCTAGLRIDEQESTRFLLLSPEINQGKIHQAIKEKIRKEANREAYREWLESDDDRNLLMQRITAIQREGIEYIRLCSEDVVRERFLEMHKVLKPRHQRDIGRVISIIKSIALLNLWWRERDDSTIIANLDDIEAGFAIWGGVSTSQELNLPPYVYNFYLDIILPTWNDKNGDRKAGFVQMTGPLGLTRKDILSGHLKHYGRHLDPTQLRKEILPMLETAGLIYQEQDSTDKRQTLVHPTVSSPISPDETYRGIDGRVTDLEESVDISDISL